MPAFDIIGDLQKLETTLRYVHLNPCRARLTSDPWNWEFSTLQEHTFPVFQPWVDRGALKTALESQLWTERLNSWPHRHAEWVLQDAWVDPGVRERLWEMPDLKALSWDDCVRLLERALVLPRGQFQRQGKHRNVAVKLLRLREPEVPIFRLAERLGMARCHVGALLKQPPLSRLEEEALRHLARCLPSPNRRVPNAVESEGKIVHERVFSARFGRMNGAKPAF